MDRPIPLGSPEKCVSNNRESKQHTTYYYPTPQQTQLHFCLPFDPPVTTQTRASLSMTDGILLICFRSFFHRETAPANLCRYSSVIVSVLIHHFYEPVLFWVFS